MIPSIGRESGVLVQAGGYVVLKSPEFLYTLYLPFGFVPTSALLDPGGPSRALTKEFHYDANAAKKRVQAHIQKYNSLIY